MQAMQHECLCVQDHIAHKKSKLRTEFNFKICHVEHETIKENHVGRNIF